MVKTESLKLEFGSITNANIEQLRLINTTTFPVRYSDKFYRDLIENGNTEYLKFAMWNGFTVGSICARIEDTENCYVKKLYIMILNVLPAYRRRGIASSMLNHILSIAVKNSSFTEVTLHVQISNDSAMQFYSKHGFENVGIINNYYKRVTPPDCYVLKLDLEVYKCRISS